MHVSVQYCTTVLQYCICIAMHVSVRTFLGAVLHHSQEDNRDQDCFFKMETGILRQATSWTTPYFLVIGGVFLWTFINYLNWDEIDISQRRKH